MKGEDQNKSAWEKKESRKHKVPKDAIIFSET